MLKQTAIALGLAMVTGSAFAAGASVGASVGANTTAGSAGLSGQGSMSAQGSSQGSLVAEFHKLDTNHNGVLSPSEAKANPQVAKLYDSMNNGASIATDPTAKKNDDNPGGVTLNQFVAGMQAAAAGAAGPAVSGGETYTVMPDGSDNSMSHDAMKAGSKMQSDADQMGHDMQQGASDAASGVDNAASAAANGVQGAANGVAAGASNTANRMQNATTSGSVKASAGANAQTGTTTGN